jgi:hypothetical protein
MNFEIEKGDRICVESVCPHEERGLDTVVVGAVVDPEDSEDI